MSDNYTHCRSLSESFVDLYTRRRVLLSGGAYNPKNDMSAYNWRVPNKKAFSVRHLENKWNAELVLNGSFAAAELTFTFDSIVRGHKINQFGDLL